MKYAQIKLHGGGSYIQPLDKLEDAVQGELDGFDFNEVGHELTLTFTLVEMEQSEYEKLPEFAGH